MKTAITIGAAGGEYMESVVVLEWAATVGSQVKQGDVIVTVETAKAATDIEAPCDGVLEAIHAQAGSEVPVSTVLGLIGNGASDLVATVERKAGDDAGQSAIEQDNEAASTRAPVTGCVGAAVQPVASSRRSVQQPAATPAHSPSGRLIVSPAARKAAGERGIALSSLTPTGAGGRIKLRDVNDHVQAANNGGDMEVNPASRLRLYAAGRRGTPAVLLLHGFGADAASWFPVDRALSGRCHVLKMDLPGHGKSPAVGVDSFGAFAASVVAGLDDLVTEGLADRVHVVGHSLGGACALAMAQARPDRVASLTLIAPGGIGGPVNHDFLVRLSTADGVDALQAALRMMVANESLIGREFSAAAMGGRADPALRMAQRSLVDTLFPGGEPSFDLRDALAEMQVPVRILWGREDAIVSPEALAHVPAHVAQHLFPGVGHVPQLEAPGEVIRIIESVVGIG